MHLATLLALPTLSAAACISSGDHNTINNALRSGGANTVVQLCENALIKITDQISFTADGQEISTENYPTGNTRATIQIAPGSRINTLIGGRQNGIKIKNIQLDGNRPGAGFQQEGGANIEIGGESTGQVVSHVASRNPRGWSCLHVIGSGKENSPCKKAMITNNDIGPCGEAGHNDQGQGLWADGISLDCTDSLVQDNVINGPTDGGIVIFGSPGSTINHNTIISSKDHLGFGAINMVDGQYQGSYAGVKVTNNKIQGQKIFNIGIGIGANVWSFNDPYAFRGPATITGNSFSGNIVFPIAVNGWTDGLTATGNDDSGVTLPKTNFADASRCVQPIQDAFGKNKNFVYSPGGLAGSRNLQGNFFAASGNMTNFLCTSLPLPNSVTFQEGELDIVSDSGPFADLHGVIAQYQGDNNVVVLQAGRPVWASGHTLNQGCGSPSGCRMRFDANGNLGTYYNNQLQWSSNTSGKGSTMVVLNEAPWIQIKEASGSVIWDTTKSS